MKWDKWFAEVQEISKELGWQAKEGNPFWKEAFDEGHFPSDAVEEFSYQIDLSGETSRGNLHPFRDTNREIIDTSDYRNRCRIEEDTDDVFSSRPGVRLGEGFARNRVDVADEVDIVEPITRPTHAEGIIAHRAAQDEQYPPLIRISNLITNNRHVAAAYWGVDDATTRSFLEAWVSENQPGMNVVGFIRMAWERYTELGFAGGLLLHMEDNGMIDDTPCSMCGESIFNFMRGRIASGYVSPEHYPDCPRYVPF